MAAQVRFENVTVTAMVPPPGRARPTLLNAALGALERLALPARLLHRGGQAARTFPLLRDASGVLCPGRLTLLLGPPGAGRSTLLRALAGALPHAAAGLHVSGDVAYNGEPLAAFVPQRAAALIEQRDVHLGELTVRETLDFAARCQGASQRRAELAELEAAERASGASGQHDPEVDAFIQAMATEGRRHHAATELILRLLGLQAAADTPVGSAMQRGISGGEKKRLTAGEMLVGGGRKVLLADEISTGLDSETTRSIVTAMRAFCHFRDATVLLALLAPPPETYALFDDVLLLAEGRVVFHGARDEALPFFASLGLVPPPGAADADFLVEALSPEEQGRMGARVSSADMAAAFRASVPGARQAAALAHGCNRESRPAGGEGLLPRRRFALPWTGRFRALASRDGILLRRNAFVYAFRTSQVALAGAVAGTLFLHTRLPPDSLENGTLLLGFIFFSVSIMYFTSFSEMALEVAQMPVYDKQARAAFYDASPFALATMLLRVPVSLAEGLIWTAITYFAVGLAPDAGRWFEMFAVLSCTHFAAGCLFRCIGAIGRDLVLASTLGSLASLLIFSLGGFVIARRNIPGWWIGGFWVNPLAYSQMALSASEFTAPRWGGPAPGGQRTLGEAVVAGRALPHRRFWCWIVFPVLLGHAAVFTAAMVLALRWLAPSQLARGAAVSEAELRRRSGAPDDASDHNKAAAAETPQRSASVAVPEGAPQPGDALSRLVLQHGGKLPPAHTAMPFSPAWLSFRDVSYAVPMPRGRGPGAQLQLLRGLTGAFLPGRLTALMGASGAGKTTLMDVLAGRKTAGRVTGDVRVNGHPKEQRTFTRISGYVEQADIHSPAASVREAVAFSADMRLAEPSSSRRAAFVQEVLELVELDGIADALVGVPGAWGLSVEQRKRLTIAVELAGNPAILFLDGAHCTHACLLAALTSACAEPTSGLDARAAAVVMRAVRAGADTGRAVACTIHQPSAAVFAAFDELYLLKPGGECVFAGPVAELVQHLEALSPDVQRFTPGGNLATWALSATSPAVEAALGLDFGAAFAGSAAARRGEARAAALSVPPPGVAPLRFASRHARGSGAQLRIALRRNWRTYWRTPRYNLVRFVITIVVAFFFGTLFWQAGTRRDTVADIFGIAGAMYAAVIFLGVNNSSTVQPVAAAERAVFYREHAAGMYGALPWALALQLVELPYVFTQTVIYSAIIYSAMGFEPTAAKIFWFALFEFLTLLAFTLYGQLAVALTPHVELAAVVSSFFYSFFNLFAGFLIPVKARAKLHLPGCCALLTWLALAAHAVVVAVVRVPGPSAVDALRPDHQPAGRRAHRVRGARQGRHVHIAGSLPALLLRLQTRVSGAGRCDPLRLRRGVRCGGGARARAPQLPAPLTRTRMGQAGICWSFVVMTLAGVSS